MYWIKYAIAYIRTKLMLKKMKATKQQVAAAINAANIVPDMGMWDRIHPYHAIRLKEFIYHLPEFIKTDTVGFGDSLLDAPRDSPEFTEVAMNQNFAVSGSWAHHIAQMARDIAPALASSKIEPKYIVVGSMGGNPLLTHQPVGLTISKSLEALSQIRSTYRKPKMIVYGLPPTVSLYVTEHAFEFESAMQAWCITDGNAVFLKLQKKFAGFLGLFPKTMMTADGVHFSPMGILEFDRLIGKAKTTKKAWVD